MRAVKAKALRKALGFHPGDKREYTMGANSFRLGPLGRDGKPQPVAITGTIRCSSNARGQYQKVKRAPVLTAAVLRAGMAGTL